jgi:uridine kinase
VRSIPRISRYDTKSLLPEQQGISLVTEYIRRKLGERSVNFREKMALTDRILSHTPSPSDFNESVSDAAQRLGVLLLEQTPQVKGIYTIMRDTTSSKEDFIFHCDRLSTLLVERAMTELPFRPSEVTTPIGEGYSGSVLDTKVVIYIPLVIRIMNFSSRTSVA